MQQSFFLQILLLAQHVSGTTMPISWGICVRFAGCCSILPTGHISLSSTSDQQLENHSTKYHRQQPLYNTLELLMMGIMVPETCWASNKICKKKPLLHLVGILFPHNNDNAQSKSHQIWTEIYLVTAEMQTRNRLTAHAIPAHRDSVVWTVTWLWVGQ